MAAASAVYAEKSVADATIDLIARRAGVTKPTVYAYFEGKEGVFRAVLEDFDTFLNTADWPPFVDGSSAEDQLHRILDVYFAGLLQPNRLKLVRAIFAEFGRRGEPPPNEEKNGHVDLARWLDEAGLCPGWSRRELEVRGALFFDMLLGAIIFPALVLGAPPPSTRARRRCLRQAIRFLFDALHQPTDVG